MLRLWVIDVCHTNRVEGTCTKWFFHFHIFLIILFFSINYGWLNVEFALFSPFFLTFFISQNEVKLELVTILSFKVSNFFRINWSDGIRIFIYRRKKMNENSRIRKNLVINYSCWQKLWSICVTKFFNLKCKHEQSCLFMIHIFVIYK